MIIFSRLPDIHEELQGLLRKTEASIVQLPRPPSGNPLGEIYQLIGDFTRRLTQHVEGTPDPNGLLQSIRPAQLQFRKAVRETAPEFRPYERRYAAQHSSPITRLLGIEEDGNEDREDSSRPAADFQANKEPHHGEWDLDSLDPEPVAPAIPYNGKKKKRVHSIVVQEQPHRHEECESLAAPDLTDGFSHYKDRKGPSSPVADFRTNDEPHYEDKEDFEGQTGFDIKIICIDEVFDRASKYASSLLSHN